VVAVEREDRTGVKARILISFHYAGRKKWNLDKLINDNTTEAPDLWADSGGFSAMTVGATITCEAYADWLIKYRHRFAAACVLDVIGDPVGTMRNQARLEALGVDVLPAYHMRSERWDIFDDICDNYGHACLGGMAGSGVPPKRQVAFLVHCLRRARDRGSAIVFHALGMTSDLVVNNIPIYSADCSSWSSARRWGYYDVWDDEAGTLRAVTMRDGSDLGRWGPLLRDHGVDPRRLLVDDPPYEVRDALAVVAYAKREAWVRDRLGPVYRPDRDVEPGLRLYMSMSTGDQFATGMRAASRIHTVEGRVAPLVWEGHQPNRRHRGRRVVTS
jgi:hypothetical protein